MKDLLRILKVSRVARRDAVLGRLRTVQAKLDAARGCERRALDEVARAQAARNEVLLGKGKDIDRAWRIAMMASCDALISVKLKELAATESAVQIEMDLVQVERKALNECERALMRNEEWATHQNAQDKLAARLDEQNQDDDLSVQKRLNAWDLKTEVGSQM